MISRNDTKQYVSTLHSPAPVRSSQQLEKKSLVTLATAENNGESKNSEFHRENIDFLDNFETFAALASDAQSAVVSEVEYNQVSGMRPKITTIGGL